MVSEEAFLSGCSASCLFDGRIDLRVLTILYIAHSSGGNCAADTTSDAQLRALQHARPTYVPSMMMNSEIVPGACPTFG
jgi:hypothetical protein